MKQKILIGTVALLLLSVCGAPILGQSAFRQPKNARQRSALFTQTSIEKGWQQAVAQKRPLLVMFTMDRCQYCEKMLSQTYRHPAIEQMLRQNAVTVLAHADSHRALIKKLGIRSFPSSLLVSPKGKVLDFVQGYVDAREFAQRVGPKLASAQRAPATAAIASQTAER